MRMLFSQWSWGQITSDVSSTDRIFHTVHPIKQTDHSSSVFPMGTLPYLCCNRFSFSLVVLCVLCELEVVSVNTNTEPPHPMNGPAVLCLMSHNPVQLCNKKNICWYLLNTFFRSHSMHRSLPGRTMFMFISSITFPTGMRQTCLYRAPNTFLTFYKSVINCL